MLCDCAGLCGSADGWVREELLWERSCCLITCYQSSSEQLAAVLQLQKAFQRSSLAQSILSSNIWFNLSAASSLQWLTSPWIIKHSQQIKQKTFTVFLFHCWCGNIFVSCSSDGVSWTCVPGEAIGSHDMEGEPRWRTKDEISFEFLISLKAASRTEQLSIICWRGIRY